VLSVQRSWQSAVRSMKPLGLHWYMQPAEIPTIAQSLLSHHLTSQHERLGELGLVAAESAYATRSTSGVYLYVPL
jgi:hypothetical protein